MTTIDVIEDQKVKPFHSSTINHQQELRILQHSLDEFKKQRLKLRGLDFHHVTGHTSLILCIVIIIILLVVYVKFMRKRSTNLKIQFESPTSICRPQDVQL